MPPVAGAEGCSVAIASCFRSISTLVFILMGKRDVKLDSDSMPRVPAALKTYIVLLDGPDVHEGRRAILVGACSKRDDPAARLTNLLARVAGRSQKAEKES